MPRGIPKSKEAAITAPIPPAPLPNAGQATFARAPLIIIQPGPNGTSYECYELRSDQVITELRLVLLDLVAQQTDVPIIRGFAQRSDAVVIPVVPVKLTRGSAVTRSTTKPARPRNGRSGDVDRSWEDELEDELRV